MCKKIKENISYRETARRIRAGESADRIVEFDNGVVVSEHVQSTPVLVILGGGHISLPLGQMGRMLGYRVLIVDDRAEFANPERFGNAAEVICMDFEQAFEKGIFPPYASYVIVTRGHMKDYECLRQVLRRTYTYVGMIGSRRKVAITFEKLRAEGYEENVIRTVHAPVGLPIGAQTPEEIAVSIVAQLIEEKSRTLSTTLAPEIMEPLLTNRSPMMMAAIIEKSGSAPRGVGSRMLVFEDGSFAGTIGGGAVEFRALQEAGEFLKDRTEAAFREYDLSSKDAANLGMICGGNVRVLLELVCGVDSHI